MSGSYGLSSRSTSYPLLKYRIGKVGSAGSTQQAYFLAPSQQSTYSFRTERGGGTEDSQLAQDLRIFRNGFSSSDPQYDRGHTFWTQNQSAVLNPHEFYLKWRDPTGQLYFYRGPLRLKWEAAGIVSGKSYYPTVDSATAESVVLGQRAISNCAPTAPQANAAVFIGELFSDLPQMVGAHLWKTRLQDYRAIGSEYLNVQFGWLPFLSDIRKAARSLSRASATLRQLERDNGRTVRRSFRFPSRIMKSSFGSYTPTFGPYVGLDPSYFSSQVPPVSWTFRETRDVWFSGAFTYCIPMDGSLLGRLQEWEAKANVLLGTRMSPEVLWELAPWSWLVDWRFAIGTAISSATRLSSDGLVLRYGYLMAHTIAEQIYSTPEAVLRGGQVVPSVTQTLRSERKERFRATPYGFGLNASALSDTQWSVLGALGLTRAPRTLW